MRINKDFLLSGHRLWHWNLAKQNKNKQTQTNNSNVKLVKDESYMKNLWEGPSEILLVNCIVGW